MTPRRTPVADRLSHLPAALLIITVLALFVASLAISSVWLRPGPTAAPPIPAPQASYIAPGQIFCLGYSVTNIVAQDASYEANLVGYSPHYPLQDTDYLLAPPSGTQKHICLPGGSWNRYGLVGMEYIIGSGWVQEWEILTGPDAGGRFSLLHLSMGQVGKRSPVSNPPAPLLLQEHIDTTYQHVHIASTLRGPGLSGYGGGAYVGWSRWPDWSQYANGGVPGPGDAHMCIITDAVAADWFYRVANGLNPPPPTPSPTPRPWTFNQWQWDAWRSTHHEWLISPWARTPHTRTALTWPAAIFDAHQWLRGVLNGGYWYGTYDKYAYACGVAYAWPRYGTYKTVYSPHDGNPWCKHP